MKNFKTMEKYREAVNFLNDHPAVNTHSGSFFSQLTFWTNQICRNGIVKDDFCKDDKKVMVSFFYGSEGFNKYKDEYFDREEREGELQIFDHVDVPYSVVYGYDWKLDKYQYAGDCCLFRFNKNCLENYICIKAFKDCSLGEEFSGIRLNMLKSQITEQELKDNFIGVVKDIREDGHWLRGREFYRAYQGIYVESDTWEEMVIDMAEKVKKNYGNFSYMDFYTDEEKENNAKEDVAFFEKIEDDEHEGMSKMIFNEKFIHVSDAELNLRWWEWYKTTEHYEKNWKETIEAEEKE